MDFYIARSFLTPGIPGYLNDQASKRADTTITTRGIMHSDKKSKQSARGPRSSSARLPLLAPSPCGAKS
jgi:hypothetical protein